MSLSREGPPVPPANRPHAPAFGHADVPDLRLLVFALFFIFGGITSLNDVVIPKLKALFTLKYAEVMLVQSAFFAAYFIVSLPAAALVRRVGYLRAAVLGLSLMTAGCLLFIPASAAGLFASFLAALFVLAAGITVVQVVANPLISLLGPPATAHSRLTFAQGFNSLGTAIFPFLGAMLILKSLSTVDPSTLTGDALDRFRIAESHVFVRTYLALAAVLVLAAGVVWLRRNRLASVAADDASMLGHPLELLRRPRFAYGVLCIFLYVGAEVSIGSLLVSYLMQSEVLAISSEQAGKHLPWYWGGAMLGRFVGAYFLRVFSPGKLLAFNAGSALALLLISAHSTGGLAAYALLAVGLCNSLMFPTIFSLASEGLGARAAQGSGLLAMAIVGGAIVPLITGKVADRSSLQFALLVPALCYAGILGFGVFSRRSAAAA